MATARGDFEMTSTALAEFNLEVARVEIQPFWIERLLAARTSYTFVAHIFVWTMCSHPSMVHNLLPHVVFVTSSESCGR